MKGQAIHLEHSSFSLPALVIPQAMAFGHLQGTHGDPGIAVDLVRQMFTLELLQARGVNIHHWLLVSTVSLWHTWDVSSKL